PQIGHGASFFFSAPRSQAGLTSPTHLFFFSSSSCSCCLIVPSFMFSPFPILPLSSQHSLFPYSLWLLVHSVL
ncbi:hypothetical protein NDU88_003452, partial [Pleurodeles waltl]